MENPELEEYKLLREDKNHLDSLSWQILYFYFAIAPLFLLVGSTLEKEHQGALLASIIFDVLLGLITTYALLEQRRSWIDAINQAKEIERNTKLGINHFLKYEERKKEFGLGLEKKKEYKKSFKFKSKFFWKLTFMLLFLSALVSLGTYLYLPTEITIPKIIISISVLIIAFLVFLGLVFLPEFYRIKRLNDPAELEAQSGTGRHRNGRY